MFIKEPGELIYIGWILQGGLAPHRTKVAILRRHFASARKRWADGALFCFPKIGDPDGSGRPGKMIDTHSLKWARSGFGPASFKAIAASFSGWYSARDAAIRQKTPL